MARSGYSDNEIIAETEKRHLASGVDANMEKALLDNAVPAALIARLKAPNLQSSPKDEAKLAAEAAMQRAATLQREQTEANLLQRRREESAALAGAAAARENVLRLLDGKLVHLEASAVTAYSATSLRDVRLFAFYFVSNRTPECRTVTPILVEWYRKTKAAHPEFEMIFVSDDRSEMTMTEDLRKFAVPFPAVRFDALRDTALGPFIGSPTPWLAAVSRAGVPVTKNLESRQFTDPGEVMQAIDYVLGELQKPGAKLKGE